ncbi:unnamed protein product, partial [Closterium sp. NIES-54]
MREPPGWASRRRATPTPSRRVGSNAPRCCKRAAGLTPWRNDSCALYLVLGIPAFPAFDIPTPYRVPDIPARHIPRTLLLPYRLPPSPFPPSLLPLLPAPFPLLFPPLPPFSPLWTPAGTFLDSATLSSVAPILPGYARRFGLTQHAVTLLLAARNVTSVLASLPIGVLLLLISVPTIFAATFSLSTLASLSLAFPLAGAGSLAAALVLQGVATQSVRSVGLFFAARVCGSGASLDEVVDQLAQKGSEGLHKILGS